MKHFNQTSPHIVSILTLLIYLHHVHFPPEFLFSFCMCLSHSVSLILSPYLCPITYPHTSHLIRQGLLYVLCSSQPAPCSHIGCFSLHALVSRSHALFTALSWYFFILSSPHSVPTHVFRSTVYSLYFTLCTAYYIPLFHLYHSVLRSHAPYCVPHDTFTVFSPVWFPLTPCFCTHSQHFISIVQF